MSRKRLQGRKVLAKVPEYTLNGTDAVSVTTARLYVKRNKIVAPAIISVIRTQYTTDQFFLSERGMFGLVYVEFNWTAFASLVRISKQMDKEELRVLTSIGQTINDDETFRSEFSFI